MNKFTTVTIYLDEIQTQRFELEKKMFAERNGWAPSESAIAYALFREGLDASLLRNQGPKEKKYENDTPRLR